MIIEIGIFIAVIAFVVIAVALIIRGWKRLTNG